MGAFVERFSNISLIGNVSCPTLFIHASFLAVPAINFFGLPGYQQETPPAMPDQYFNDHRAFFLRRMSARRKNSRKENPWPTDTWNPCDISTGMESDQERETVSQDLTVLPGGSPSSAARETAAEAAKFAGVVLEVDPGTQPLNKAVLLPPGISAVPC